MEPATLSLHRKLQIAIFFVLSSAVILHAIHPITAGILHFLSVHPLLTVVTTLAAGVLIFFHLRSQPHPVFLLNYSCYKPPPERKCNYELASKFLLTHGRFTSPEPVEFMRNIYSKSGLSDATYVPPFMFEESQTPSHKNAVQEAEEGIFSAVDSLLSKTNISPEEIDVVIVTCGGFSPSPSLSSLIVNHYNMKPDVKTYNLSGMGCSSGVLTVDLARRILIGGGRKIKNILVVITERITGVSLTKDLIRVAGVNLRQHVKILAPRVLPLSQLVRYICSVLAMAMSSGKMKPIVPDFMNAFEHICVHTGGKAVIEQVGRVMKFDDFVTEPARMTLNRFGNTSSSLVFYELAYFEAKKRVKKGDKMWMLAFGTGFKVGSLVWKWINEPEPESDNPWNDSIHQYPLKTW
ncbi:hypothetical protein E3N88_26388 [Mikania micrantha]|uniref:very-long-chain 3-oxoacyl-CoA synthase n=1 Tax=Mikania micrantha TaxID=192012 RepID=A0A5N6N7E2_9ASTR|nr:hypothetical protein E3N88_26388 [Mikania micrantha]